jgi:hypothetical protein
MDFTCSRLDEVNQNYILLGENHCFGDGPINHQRIPPRRVNARKEPFRPEQQH